ncbi:MAG: hypothetical protein JJV98_18740 [Desulfosarcina sp.]|nr:hypothetical protein [Desulfobacterales bacterium]
MKRHIVWMVAAVMMLSGCASGIRNSYVGQAAKPDGRIALRPGDIHQEKWQTNDIAVNFEYQREAGRIDLAGNIELQKRLSNFTQVDYVRVYVHFLDTEGIILASQHLWSSSFNTEPFFVRFTFTRQYPLPPDTHGLTFSYTGQMSDGGDRGWAPGGGDRIDWRFWRTP